MTFSLTVDAKAFRAHQQHVISDFSKVGAGVVPVIKGNGYGFGRKVLASEAARCGLTQIAVGNVWELDQALTDFAGQVVVLEPFNSADHAAKAVWQRILSHNADRVIVTLSSTDLARAAEVNVRNAYLEVATSLNRFGLPAHELIHAADAARHNIAIKGLTLHMPIAEPVITHVAEYSVGSHNARKFGDRLLEIFSWMTSYQEIASKHDLPLHVSLSHVTAKDVELLKSRCTEFGFKFSFDVRIGTNMWLSAPKALTAQGTILEIHELTDHQHVGYQQVDSDGHKRLVVVSGGTAHGVALAAPIPRTTIRKRSIALAEGFAQAVGKVKSPFSHSGKNLVFAEPPHMHVSLLWSNDSDLKVGDELDCNVRNTTTTFDVVLGLD
jgi:alanine racemase